MITLWLAVAILSALVAVACGALLCAAQAVAEITIDNGEE